MVNGNGSLFVALITAAFLFAVTIPIAKRVARSEDDPSIRRIVMWGLGVHLLFAPISIYVVQHNYKGLTDYTKYLSQGALLARNFDSFHFTLSGTSLHSAIGAGGVSVAAGVVFAIIGVNKVATFFVFGWLAFLGSIGFFRAYSVTFPEASHRRYALLIFFFPSSLFWTAGVSKESIMFLSLGVASYGAARLLTRKPGGILLLILGGLIGLYIRPQELLLLTVVVATATLFRRRGDRPLGAMRRIAVTLAQFGMIVVAYMLTKQVRGPVFSLTTIAKNNSVGSAVSYSASPLAFPKDLYTVLLDPLPINAHSGGQHVAAIENTVLLILIVLGLRGLRRLPWAALARPYVMACFLYSAIFTYVFAALSNLGLIDRERVLVVPFVLVLLAIPVTRKGDPLAFPWEKPLRKDKRSLGRHRKPVRQSRFSRWIDYRPAVDGHNGNGRLGEGSSPRAHLPDPRRVQSRR